MNKKYLIILIVIIILGGGIWYFSSKITNSPVQKTLDEQNTISQSSAQNTFPAILDIQVQKPNLIVYGNNLAKVEIWNGSGGTGAPLDESNLQKLGDAVLNSSNPQVWIFPIPTESSLGPFGTITMFAKGFDASRNLIGSVHLPYNDQYELYQALWGPNPNK